MSLKNKLFEFDKKASCCHYEEGQSPDAGIQKEKIGLLHRVRNDVLVIGTDEAGRGPGAGGVFASAVYFNALNDELIEQLSKLNDSKKLSKKAREELYDIILNNTINSTVCIEVEEIEKINILNASLKAMKLACENVIKQINAPDVILNLIDCSFQKLVFVKDFPSGQHRTSERPCDPETSSGRSEMHNGILVLVDGNKLIKQFEYNQEFIIKGDSKSASIAAASILAKVSRDRYMDELDAKFPNYNWKKNAGYLTKQHLAAIDEFGITPAHRKTFLRKHFERITQQSMGLDI
jgi:ribonuclease HII